MNREPIKKHLAIAFGIALVTYVVLYSLIEHQRTHKGPWQLRFMTNTAGVGELVINHPKLGITNMALVFPGQTISATNLMALTFDQPIGTPFDLPLGQCIFMDLTSLPGTLVFEISGHEIQLLPRVLTIDKKEQPWQSGTAITLPWQKGAP